MMGNMFSLSAGKKFFMSIAGVFLLFFLVIHLGINILLIIPGQENFYNIVAFHMQNNTIIRVTEIILFGSFIIHMLLGLFLSFKNVMARPVKYKKTNNSQTSFFSKYILHTSFILLIFLILHLFDFYVKSNFLNEVTIIKINGFDYPDLASLVLCRFKIWWVVLVYVVALAGLGFHLHHGFQSAFQTLGINEKANITGIKIFGVLYTIIITFGFITIPVVIYFLK